MRSPIRWLGGKFYTAKKIIKLFPPHKTYVEPFGGAGWVLFKKEPSEVEVYNDIDQRLVNFFKVLKDEEKFKRFKELAELTIFSREMFDCARKYTADDEVESALMFYITTRQSFGVHYGMWLFNLREPVAKQLNAYYKSIYHYLYKVHKRISGVVFENSDYKNIIFKYDSKDTLFYLDPPYVPETRNSDVNYIHEMSVENHEELVDIVLNVKGKVVLSGYSNRIYKRLEDNGWEKIDFKTYCNIVLRDSLPKRTDSVWLNFNTKMFLGEI